MNPFKEYKHILDKYVIQECIHFLEQAWNEPHRKYHNIHHLNEILNSIQSNRFSLSEEEFDILVLSAFFHDVYYNPRNNLVNEDESIKRFIASVKANPKVINYVIGIIECTKYRKIPVEPLLKMFWEIDNSGFKKGIKYMLENEKQIREEYKHVPRKLYKKNRIKFLESNFGLFNEQVNDDLHKLINYVNINY